MANDEVERLIQGVRTGRISRREFLIKATALGVSASGISAMLTVADATPSAAATYSLLSSSSSNRSNPTPLGGRTVSGNIYVFTSPGSGVSQVRFYLDDPAMSATPFRVENTAPHDFAGGTTTVANPFDTRTLKNGTHTITAAVVQSAGGTEVVSSTFSVTNVVQAADQIHLAWIGDPSTTLTVVWRVRDAATPSTVEYRVSGSTTWSSVTGGVRTSGTSGSLRQANLSGLTPSTTYEYRVRGDGGAWSSVYTTRTAPPPGPADFSVIYFADTGLAGRTDGLTTGTTQLVNEIAKLSPLLTLPGGDYAYYDTDKRYGSLENTIDAWFNQVQPFAARSPMMPTYGNHEVLLGEGYQPWANRFPTPSGYDSRRNYSFDIGDVHFVSIHAVENYTALPAAQLSWIEQDLQAARAAGKRWIVPYMHVSVFADGTNHPSNLELRRQLGPLFERYGVKLVLSSHDQAYERTYPLRDVPVTNTPTSTSKTCYTPSDGTTWVKISPGGKLSNISKGFSPFKSNPPPAWTAYRNNSLHVFSRISFTQAGTMRVETYGVKGDGTPPTIIDSFQYDLNGCGATPPPTPGGLRGEYYDNQDLTSLKLTRTDPTINFNWGSGSPDPSIGGDTFSVRWTGQVKADYSEAYTFYTTSNDGVRLWVNGQQIVNNWTQHAATENQGTITLAEGQWYSIRLEYFEGTGSSLITLSYSGSSTPKQVVPADKLSPDR